MKRIKWVCPFLIIYLLMTGCSQLGSYSRTLPQSKPETGNQELTYLEKVRRPPLVFFDLANQIGALFQPLNNMDWPQTQAEYQKTLTIWESAKAAAGNIKGVKESDEAILALGASIAAGKTEESMAGLNKFTNHLQELLTNYKLSPLSDIVNLETISRNISWELENRDFKKAFVRTEELKKTWGQSKTNLEQAGILGEVTKAHETVDRIKGSVTAENKMATEDQLKKFTESLGKIRDFYKQKNESKLP